jgi:hypothetical protein
MSEYQFYEFRAIDKPLSRKDKVEIGSWSSRSDPSNTGATFIYSYGNFPKDEMTVVEQYFDAMFYISNWGSKRLIFKLPNSHVDVKHLKQYCTDGLSITSKPEFTLIDIDISEEEGNDEWIEGEGCLSSLASLRDDIISGDYRSLYLIWLKVSIEDILNDCGVTEPESYEPNIPENLQALNGALLDLIEIFEIDKDAIEVAAQRSAMLTNESNQDHFEDIESLSESEKNDFLKRLLQSEPQLSAKLKNRLKKVPSHDKGINKGKRRTIEEMAQAVRKLKEQKNEKKKKELEQRELAKLGQTEKDESYLWNQSEFLIKQKNTKAYDEAIQILKELKALAKHKKQYSTFCEKIEEIRLRYTRLSGLIVRIDNARLIEK